MAGQDGAAFLLETDIATVATIVAGMRTTAIALNADAVDITNKDSTGWRDLLGGAGIKSASISGSGVFATSTALTELQTRFLAGTIVTYTIKFEGGATLAGDFLITSLEYAGDHDNAATYSISLESSGAITAA